MVSTLVVNPKGPGSPVDPLSGLKGLQYDHYILLCYQGSSVYPLYGRTILKILK